jgi:hypothetical protein
MDPERWRHALALRWRSIFGRARADQDLHDELQDHLERQIEASVAAGIDRAEARRLALSRLGGVEQVKERCRDARGVGFLESLGRDLRYGGRTLRREPVFAAVVILTLALGIGPNAAVFGLVDGILLTRLSFPAPERLASVTGTYPQGAFAALRQEIRTFDARPMPKGTGSC